MATDTAAATEATKAAPPNGRLKDKVVLVTGATKGIGRAVAHAAAAEGARLAICGRDRKRLKIVADEISSLDAEVMAAKIDIRDYESAIKLVDAVHRAYGRIDVLVNNHGILGQMETLMEYPVEAWEEVMRVNLHSAFWVVKEALGKMAPQRSGSVILVSSGVGHKGRAKWGAYSVSKFGIEGMMQVLADEMAEYKVRVNSLNPGPVRTDMRAAAYPGEDPNTLPAPADITNAVIYLASDASAGLSGEAIDARDWIGRSDF